MFSLEIMDRKLARTRWREAIKECWDHRCAYCNGVPIDDRSLTQDHIRPRSHGGQDLTSNIVPACERCNSHKGSTDWRTWFRRQVFYCPVREAEIEAWMAQGDRRATPWWEVGVGDLEHCVRAIEEREGLAAA